MFDPATMVRVQGRVYTKLERIGKGGSSVVFRVAGPDGPRALKEVDLRRTDDAVLAGYVNEANMLTSLKVC